MRADLPVLAEYIRRIKVNVDESDVLHRLRDRWRWPVKLPGGIPSIDIINEDYTKTPAIYKEDGYLDSHKCIDLYYQGKTLIFSSCQWLFKDVTVISDLINKAHGYHCNMNMYFGKGTKAISFKEHSHNYDVLVKNVYGDSDWIINNKKISLKGQDVVYFEKHTPHEVIKINQPKLSLTFNLK